MHREQQKCCRRKEKAVSQIETPKKEGMLKEARIEQEKQPFTKVTPELKDAQDVFKQATIEKPKKATRKKNARFL